MTMRRKIILAAMLGASTTLAGCISSPEGAPAWYADSEANQARGYPSLHDVPSTSIANTSQRYWSRVESEVLAAGEEVRANPRAQPTADDTPPDEFIERARNELEAARSSHEP